MIIMDKQNSVSINQDQQETSQIRRDLWKVIILNVILFAGLIALYYINRNNGSVDQFFGKFLDF